MLRLKYLIYFPIFFALVALFWLLFSYITGCTVSPNSASMRLLEKELIKKKDIFIEEHIQSLNKREEKQDKLLAEIENLKKIVKEQIEREGKKGTVLNTGNQHFNANLPIIYGITPTHSRLTQKADLTRLCQTFLHVKNFHWIIVEDAESKTNLVEKFLTKCGVMYTHLAVKTTTSLIREKNDPRWLKPRGVEQRNTGLKWLRDNVDKNKARGVVYFIDDDNTYDLEIFEQMRETKKVSIWPVGLVGGLKWEGPVCENGKVIKFHTAWDVTRPFPIDMAGFAINLKLLFDNPSAIIDLNAPRGHLESSLLKLLVKRDELEALADNCMKILVWHTQTAEPKMKQEKRLMSIGQQSDPLLEV